MGASAKALLNNTAVPEEEAALLMSVPIRIVAMHFCVDSVIWYTLLALLKVAASFALAANIRAHHGK